MCATSRGLCHLVNAYGEKAGWLIAFVDKMCGWQVKLCDSSNTCHTWLIGSLFVTVKCWHLRGCAVYRHAPYPQPNGCHAGFNCTYTGR